MPLINPFSSQDCAGSTYDYADCTMIDGYSTPQWIVNGTLNDDVVYVYDESTLFVFGDLIANWIVFTDYHNEAKIIVDGCVNPSMRLIKFSGYPSAFTITFKDGCAVPVVAVDDIADYYQISYSTNQIVIKYWDNDGASPNDAAYAERLTRDSIIIGVLASVGSVGLIVGLAVGIHFYLKKKSVRQQIKQMQHEELY